MIIGVLISQINYNKMTKARSIRKSVLKKKKIARKNAEGTPKRKSVGARQVKMMREFNQFIQKQIKEGKVISHEEAGLPEVISPLRESLNE